MPENPSKAYPRPFRSLTFTWWVLFVAGVLCPSLAPAQQQAKPKTKPSENPYLRIQFDDQDQPVAMQTSVVTFESADRPGVRVDLIGAVHVADEDYFARLNKIFQNYEAVLYELVAPENHNIPRGGKSQHPVGQMQQTMKQWLDLAYQLEEVDYTKENFVHADMSPTEFSRVMKQRGESFFQMMMRAMGAALAKQTAARRSTDFELMFAFGASDRSLRLKRIMSTQFEDLEASMKAIEGENGSTIIGQRNKKALDVLEKELAKGSKQIAIFYGAGHMQDMEERLAKRLSFQRSEQPIRWLTAWDMSDQ